MIVLKGIGVYDGISIGSIKIKNSEKQNFKKHSAIDSNTELKRYQSAKQKAIEYTKELYQKVYSEYGKEEAEIFKSHELMLNDNDFNQTITQFISQENLCAECAVEKTAEKFSEFFLNMDSPYMQCRASDVKDISICILKYLSNDIETKSTAQDLNSVILMAKDLVPSEVSFLKEQNVKGVILEEGSAYSHASILLKAMKIPSVIGIKNPSGESLKGKLAILDGFSGTIYLDPDEQTLKIFENKLLEHQTLLSDLNNQKGKSSVTLDGKRIKLYANMNNPQEIDALLENDPEGIGLVRSEFIYLNRSCFPTESEQVEIYKKILQKMNGKEVVIRTLDIGSDKKIDYFNLPQEHNPALGYRGVRVYRDKEEVLLTQLKAIYKASVYGNVSVMFPMITTLEEVKQIKKYIQIAHNELLSIHAPFSRDIKHGIMIETPAAVMISDDLAKEVDFFSIGTNDLTQYTLAVDRQNTMVNYLFSPRHKSILRMIKTVVENAHKNGIEVGICGESASDEVLLETFLALGVDELSVSPGCVLKLRKKISTIDVSKVKEKILLSL